jgi:hypothetical protein
MLVDPANCPQISERGHEPHRTPRKPSVSETQQDKRCRNCDAKPDEHQCGTSVRKSPERNLDPPRAGRRFVLPHEPLCHRRQPKRDDTVSRVSRVARARVQFQRHYSALAYPCKCITTKCPKNKNILLSKWQYQARREVRLCRLSVGRSSVRPHRAFRRRSPRFRGTC